MLGGLDLFEIQTEGLERKSSKRKEFAAMLLEKYNQEYQIKPLGDKPLPALNGTEKCEDGGRVDSATNGTKAEGLNVIRVHQDITVVVQPQSQAPAGVGKEHISEDCAEMGGSNEVEAKSGIMADAAMNGSYNDVRQGLSQMSSVMDGGDDKECFFDAEGGDLGHREGNVPSHSRSVSHHSDNEDDHDFTRTSRSDNSSIRSYSGPPSPISHRSFAHNQPSNIEHYSSIHQVLCNACKVSVHLSVTVSGNRNPCLAQNHNISGARWTCLTCHEYNLCDMCHSIGAHDHKMLRIEHPADYEDENAAVSTSSSYIR